MRLTKQIVPLLLLGLLPALFLWKLTVAGRIVVGLDPFNFFYPYHDALASALEVGRLPQWNPTLFGGAPFLADSQAQVFYPLGWPFLWLDAPAALTWSIVLHLGIAAVGVYAWARHGLGIGPWGSWLAGAIFSLGGYLGAQVEHVNQVQAAAWLPWLLLGYELARGGRAEEIRRVPYAHSSAAYNNRTGRIRGVVLGAAALAMSFLAGHAQTTFISLFMLALWGLRSMVRETVHMRMRLLAVHRLGLWFPATGIAFKEFVRLNLLPLAAIVAIGTLLAMVQLVPTQQLSALSTRAGGLTLREAAAFSLDPRLLPRALLPTFGQDVRLLSEYVGWIGFTGLALALIGVFQPLSRAARDFGILAAGSGLLLALGGYNPLFWLLWRVVPGFDLFRAPARWLLLWAFGAAVLAGAGLEALASRPLPFRLSARLLRDNRMLVGLAAIALAIVALFLTGEWPRKEVLLWWFGAAFLALLIFASRPRWPAKSPIPYVGFVVLLVLLELWAASWGLDYQKATAPEAYNALRPAPAHLIASQPERGAARLLSLSDLTWDPGDLAALETRHASILDEEAIYDLVVATKLKEVLAPNQPMRWGLLSADGYGGGLLPIQRWVEFQALLPLEEVVPDGRLREQLTRIPDEALLDVMGVEWLVADKVHDWWSEGIYHDLGAPLLLLPDAPLLWDVKVWEATSLSFVVIGEWPEDPGTVTVDGRSYPLRLAQEVTSRETQRGLERHMRLAIEPDIEFEEVAILAAEPWVLGGLTLFDERLSGFLPLVADPRLERAFSGDVKVYRRVAAPGRAWVAPVAQAVQTLEQAQSLLASSTFAPTQHVVVEQQDEVDELPRGGTGEVLWLREEAEAITLQVQVPDGGWLVLADAPLPGWRVWVDGEEQEWYAANLINRALFLPPGEHVVEWRYRTPGLTAGGVGTLSGVLFLTALLLYARR